MPYPLLSLLLLIMWLLLWQSVAPYHLLTGIIAALLVARLMLPLEQERPSIKRLGAIAKLFVIVFYDVVRSNFAVAGLIFGRSRHRIHSGFVNIPLELRSRYGLAALATIITATPGTFWAAYDSRTNVLTIHVLDHVDDKYYLDVIKERYEKKLLEIFE